MTFQAEVNARLDYLTKSKRALAVGMTIEQFDMPHWAWWNTYVVPKLPFKNTSLLYNADTSVKVEFENGTAVMSKGKTVGELRELADKRGGFKKTRSDLEAVWEDVGEPVMKAVKAVAPFIAIIPGIGTGVAVALSAASSLALGDPISDAAMNGIAAAVPGGPLAQGAFKTASSAGLAIARGEPVDKATLAVARDVLPTEDAKKAYDMGLAVATAKGLQEEGFRVAAPWIDGASEAAKVELFQRVREEARAKGKSPGEVLMQPIQATYKSLNVNEKQRVKDLYDAVRGRGDLFKLTSHELALASNSPEVLAKIALAWAATGINPAGYVAAMGRKPANLDTSNLETDPCKRYKAAEARGSVAATKLFNMCLDKERAERVRAIAERQSASNMGKVVFTVGALTLAGVVAYKFWWMRR